MRRAKRAEQALAAVRAELQELTGRLSSAEAEVARLTSERDELNRAHEAQTSELELVRTALGEERQARERAESEAQDLRSQIEIGETASGSGEDDDDGGAVAPASESASQDAAVPDPGVASTSLARPEQDGCWALLLADMTRRWAAVVGAPPQLRQVHLGAVPDQLTEALTREIDRLREEVGVDISFQADTPIEPADPIVFLLAAAHLLGELAAGCQKVTVELDGKLVLAGDEWIGPLEDLEVARERALAAGAVIDPLTAEEISPEELGQTEGDDASILERQLSELDQPGPGKPGTPMFNVRLAMHPAT